MKIKQTTQLATLFSKTLEQRKDSAVDEYYLQSLECVKKAYMDGVRFGIKKERQRFTENLDIFSDEFPDSTTKDFIINDLYK